VCLKARSEERRVGKECFEGLLALLALLYFPPRDSLLLWSERDDGYLVRSPLIAGFV